MSKKTNRPDKYSGAGNVCLKCRTHNPPDRVFCNSCGAKLQLNHNPFDDMSHPGRIKPIFRACAYLLSIAVIIAVAMVFFPPRRIGMDGQSRSYQLYEKKVEEIHKAIEDGRSFTVVVNETEINSFLKRRLEDYLEQHRFDSGTILKDIRIMITPDYVAVQMKSKHGPFSITRGVRGVPSIAADQFVFDIEKLTVGILPLPTPIGSLVAARVAAVFSGMEAELMIVENLAQIELSEGKMRLRFN